jgi:uncharacterized protein (TIGR01244 family)
VVTVITMTRIKRFAASIAACTPLALGACASTRTPPPVGVAAPVEHGGEIAALTRDGEVWFGGQPDEAAMRWLASQGVRTVISLRDEDAMAETLADEPALADSLGMRHITMPVMHGGLTARDIDRFATVLESARTPVLVHCSSSNTVGAVWASYLALHRGYTIDDAVERGRAAGLTREEAIERVRALLAEPRP